MGERHDGAGDVGRRRETPVWVAPERRRLDLLVAGDLLEGGGHGDSGADPVGRDLAGGQLHRELADVGLERSLGGGHRAVVGQHATAARGGHGEDPSPGSHQPAPDDLLSPIDEAVGHHVHGHVHLGLGHGVLHRVRHVGLEGPEGEGMQEDAEPSRLPAPVEGPLHLGGDLGPLFRVGGVDVEEAGLAAEGPNLSRDPLRVRLGGLPVKVHAEDVEPRPREREAHGLSETGGGAQHQGPAAERDRRVGGHIAPSF